MEWPFASWAKQCDGGGGATHFCTCIILFKCILKHRRRALLGVPHVNGRSIGSYGRDAVCGRSEHAAAAVDSGTLKKAINIELFAIKGNKCAQACSWTAGTFAWQKTQRRSLRKAHPPVRKFRSTRAVWRLDDSAAMQSASYNIHIQAKKKPNSLLRIDGPTFGMTAWGFLGGPINSLWTDRRNERIVQNYQWFDLVLYPSEHRNHDQIKFQLLNKKIRINSSIHVMYIYVCRTLNVQQIAMSVKKSTLALMASGSSWSLSPLWRRTCRVLSAIWTCARRMHIVCISHNLSVWIRCVNVIHGERECDVKSCQVAGMRGENMHHSENRKNKIHLIWCYDWQ